MSKMNVDFENMKKSSEEQNKKQLGHIELY